MRLIDADEILQRLEKWDTNDGIDKAFYNFCVRRINEQPTAYDVEKVVTELEEKRDKSIKRMQLNAYGDIVEYLKGCRKLYDNIIEIVRNGGKK